MIDLPDDRIRELAALAFGADEPDEPAPPAEPQVDRYALGPLLGQGGHGSVYRAHDRVLGRDVALKLLATGASPDALARFQREARMAAALRHPNVVTVHDVGVRDGRPYYTMELVQGTPLQGGDPRQVARLGAQVARGLEAAHARGVIHRDVKPDNIVVTPEGRAVLVDFSIAREALPDQRITATGIAAGTPAYMSPEQAHGKRAAIGPEADIYGLGATLYHALCGRPPHEADTVVELLYAVLHASPVPPSIHRPDVPLALEAIVLRALAKAPEDRQPSARALAEELEAFAVSGEAPPQPPPLLDPPRVPPRPRARRRPRRRALVAALTIVAAGALALAVAWPEPASLSLVVDAPLSDHVARDDEPVAVRGRVTLTGAPASLLRVTAGGARLVVAADGAFAGSLPPVAGRLTVEATCDGRPELRRAVEVDIRLDPLARWLEARPATARPPLPLRAGLRCSATPDVYVWDGGRGVPIELVHVPSGPFTMGTPWAGNAMPAHVHILERGFFIGRFEATWREYRAFLAAMERTPPSQPGQDLEPAGGLTWDEARAFAAWLGLRLPSDAEWEKAARGTDGREFPWGAEFALRCNYNDASCDDRLAESLADLQDAWNQVDDGFPGIAPVGSFPDGVSPYGAHDMAGNVSEWCEDWFDPQANGLYGTDRYPPSSGTHRCLRGGSFASAWLFNRGGHREGQAPGFRGAGVGVRFALDVAPR
jgi:formylglycine-generating enzyme required for sulfatase activity